MSKGSHGHFGCRHLLAGGRLVLASLCLIAGSGVRAASEGRQTSSPAAVSSPSTKPQPDQAAPSLRVSTHAPPAAGKKGETCFPVKAIVVRGIVLVEPEALQSKITPLAIACLGNEGARAILSAINESYAAKGYVTTQGYLPDQDIRKSHELVINIIAGRIGKIVYKEDDGDAALAISERVGKNWAKVREAKGPWTLIAAISQFIDGLNAPLDRFQILPPSLVGQIKIWNSFITAEGDVVQIDDVQQGVDQINRVPSSHAEVKLTPGDAPATSTLIVDNNRIDAFRVFAGYEVNGSDLNGSNPTTTVANRLRLDVAKDNLIGLNDAWRASYAGGIDTNEVRAAFAIPFRRFTLSLDAGYSESLSQVGSSSELFTRSGTVTTDLSYLLQRDHDKRTLLDASLTWRDNQRFLDGTQLAPQNVAYARLGATQIWALHGLQLSYGVGIDQGLSILGATPAPVPTLPSTPRPQFLKFDGQASLANTFANIGTLRVDLNGQWTGHPLYTDDQLVLGSVSTVRGFAHAVATVDRGVIVRLEFTPILPLDVLFGAKFSDAKLVDDAGLLRDLLVSLQPYVFSDYGWGRDIANEANLQRSSIGTGLRYKQGRFNLDVSIAEPIFRAGGAKPKDWLTPEMFMTVSVRTLLMEGDTISHSAILGAGIGLYARVKSTSRCPRPMGCVSAERQRETRALVRRFLKGDRNIMNLKHASALVLLLVISTPALAETKPQPAASGSRIAAGIAALDAKNYPAAIKAFNEAYSAGIGDGAFYLGRMVELGVGLEADRDKARILYLSAADKGSAKAMNRVGLMAFRGEGMLQDYTTAREMICKGADLGDADAQFNCASLIAEGQGGEKDLAKALAYDIKAADQGHIGALNLLGFTYREGRGVPRDLLKAQSEFEKTASKGNPTGLYELAAMYEAGSPMPRDLVKAHLYYNLAAARQYPLASQALQRLSAQMTEEDIVKAQAQAKTWKAQ